MFNGKLKAVTFSYDDGVEQDKRLIELLDKYNLKGTFNLNSKCFGNSGFYTFNQNEKTIVRNIIKENEIASVYKNHEVAVHTLTHPNLTTLCDEEVREQVLKDKQNLEKIVGYTVEGMAYPCGGVNNDDRVAKIVGECRIKYSRTITSTFNFDLQDNLLRFNPTVYHRQKEDMFRLCEEFISLKPQKPQILYIWGHSYELDYSEQEWKDIEEIFKMVSNKDDTFYGTNSQVLLGR